VNISMPRLFARRTEAPLEVVIAGGGVAALEAALALRALARERVSVTLLAPAPEFTYRPMAVLEPFVRRPPRQLPLAKFAAEIGASFVQDGVVEVELERGVLRTALDRELPFGALLVAVGATVEPPLAATIAVDPSDMRPIGAAVEKLVSGACRSAAFVAPSRAWPLPAYELALLARERAPDAEIVVFTAEGAPLEVFGESVSAAVAEALDLAEIGIVSGARVEAPREGPPLVNGRDLTFDRIIAVPQLSGPAIPGLAADADGFLPVDERCLLAGAEAVYAAGDATDFPVKFGGIAARQADTAAQSIAAQAGALLTPAPFDGVVHGFLIGGDRRPAFYFTTRIEAGRALESRVSQTPTHSPEAKIAAPHLAPFLDERWVAGQRWLAEELAWEDTIARLEREGDSATSS
jgi:sulfide:quinone oxidoreductase